MEIKELYYLLEKKFAYTDQIEKINSENKLLTAKLYKLNNQFKNVKDYLNKN